MLYRYYCIMVSVILIHLSSAISAQPSPDQILSRYEQAIQSLPACAFEILLDVSQEASGGITIHPLQKHQTMKINYCRDNGKYYIERNLSYIDNGDLIKDISTPRYIVDDENFIEYQLYPENIADSYLQISSDINKGTSTVRHLTSVGSIFDGYIPGDSDISLPIIMKDASGELLLSEEMKTISGNTVYLLQTKNKYGDYKVWIDPQAGFNPRRIEIKRTGEDIVNGKPLSEYSNQCTELITQVEFSGIQQIEGLFVPTEMKVLTKEVFSGDRQRTKELICKKTNIDLHPDFDSIKTKALNIPNGTKVYLTDVETKGIAYEWFDGAVRTTVDHLFLQSLDERVEILKKDPTINIDNTQTNDSELVSPARGSNENKSGESSANLKQKDIFNVPIILLGGIIVSGLIILSVVSRKK